MARVPEWAWNIDSERVKVACWFHDAKMQPKQGWDGIIEVTLPTPCMAEWVIDQYWKEVVSAAKQAYPRNTGVLIRPERLQDGELRRWCYKSGLVSRRSMADSNSVIGALMDAASGVKWNG